MLIISRLYAERRRTTKQVVKGRQSCAADIYYIDRVVRRQPCIVNILLKNAICSVKDCVSSLARGIVSALCVSCSHKLMPMFVLSQS